MTVSPRIARAGVLVLGAVVGAALPFMRAPAAPQDAHVETACAAERDHLLTERDRLARRVDGLAAPAICPDTSEMDAEMAALTSELFPPAPAPPSADVDLRDGGTPFPEGTPPRFNDPRSFEESARARAAQKGIEDPAIAVDCSEYPCLGVVMGFGPMPSNVTKTETADGRVGYTTRIGHRGERPRLAPGAGALSDDELREGGSTSYVPGTDRARYATELFARIPYPLPTDPAREATRMKRLKDQVCSGPRGQELCPGR